MDGETVQVGGTTTTTPAPGTAGVQSQVPGAPTTVSGVAGATGGVGPGNLIQSDLDQELYKFKSDDTPLMQLMLKAKKVKVNSPEVEHYMIDEPRSSVTTTTKVTAGTASSLLCRCLPTMQKFLVRMARYSLREWTAMPMTARPRHRAKTSCFSLQVKTRPQATRFAVP